MPEHHCTEIFAGAMISVVQYCAATVHGLLETMAPPILHFESHVVHAPCPGPSGTSWCLVALWTATSAWNVCTSLVS
jgi:hypothetical protein